MRDELQSIQNEAKQAIVQASTVQELETIRVYYLGKKGQVTNQLKKIGQLPKDQRPEMGQMINEVKNTLQQQIDHRRQELEEQALQKKLTQQQCDVTLPGRGQKLGAAHPIIRVTQRLEAIFNSMGFTTASGPEIEDDYHNFEALNTPQYHPARAMQATFYLPSGHVLRTHTSSVQIRTMSQQNPPIRVIAPGRVYRRDLDPTHSPMFHQLEGLWVDQNVTFAHLKGIMTAFLRRFFESDQLQLRFRPSYFPFTEPSAEVDIECLHCQGDQCSICKGQGWLEILGCGMVDPEVFKSVHIDPHHYQGFAFGLGIDRLAMLSYGIQDIRLMFEGDHRFLNQFIQGFA